MHTTRSATDGYLAVAGSTLALATIAMLVGLFLLLLAGSFRRARRARRARVALAGVEVAVTERPVAGPALAPSPKPRVVLSRRDFFRTGLLSSFLVFTAQFGGASLAFLWPNLRGGFGSVITLPDSVDRIREEIRSSRQPFYFGAGRFYLINYTGNGDQTGGLYEGITSEGLMALFQKCAHLGCRVPFCEQSQWFECPCHGTKYNYAGEYQLGPAPTGLHRFAVTVEGTTVKVDTTKIVPGPPRGTDTIRQAPEGPFCVG